MKKLMFLVSIAVAIMLGMWQGPGVATDAAVGGTNCDAYVQNNGICSSKPNMTCNENFEQQTSGLPYNAIGVTLVPELQRCSRDPVNCVAAYGLLIGSYDCTESD